MRRCERTGEPDARLPDRLDPDAPATIVHTSGTTAAPKPVALTVGNWLWNALGSALALGLDPQDRWLCTLPLSHVGGLAILLRSAIYGTTVVLHERFDTEAAIEAIGRDRVTLASLVPTTLERLLDAGLKAPNPLRVALIGERPAGARARGAGAGGRHPRRADVRDDGGLLAGRHLAAAARDPGARSSAPRAIGRTARSCVAGPTVAPARRTRRLAARGRPRRARRTGRLTVTGRKADTIVTGGENVAPAEVEAALLEHPAVADAGVHGRPDPRVGRGGRRDRRAARRQPRRGGGAARARRLPARALQGAEADRVRRELPHTASGKLLRRELSHDPTAR